VARGGGRGGAEEGAQEAEVRGQEGGVVVDDLLGVSWEREGEGEGGETDLRPPVGSGGGVVAGCGGGDVVAFGGVAVAAVGGAVGVAVAFPLPSGFLRGGDGALRVCYAGH